MSHNQLFEQLRTYQFPEKLIPLVIHNALAGETYPLPARRMENSRMDTGKLSRALGLNLPDWTIHVDRAVDAMVSGMSG